MRRALLVLTLTTLAGAGCLGVGVLGGPASSARAPAPDTIVAITGSAADGFTIEHYDGSSLSPPTDSEARAECSEYDTRLARVRCRTEVRTWYRDLAATQQALDWAHARG